MRRILLIVVAVAAVGASAPVSAHTAAGHIRPAGPAARHFPRGFELPRDTEWNEWKLGGFGGSRTARSRRLPVVFVHGNNTDHAGWYPVASVMTQRLGWRAGDLWAVAYNGVGCTNDGGLFTTNRGYRGWTYQQDRAASRGCIVTGNRQNVPDVRKFVLAVLAYTRAPRVHIVAHSLGVTVARRMLWEHPELYRKVAGFVGIAGANHGTSFCPPGSEDTVESCNEIAAGTRWLAQMNDGAKGERRGRAGSNETPPPTRWMTVYDGTGIGDPAFTGPSYARSPRLRGAHNCAYPGFYHNDLRVDPRIVRDYAKFLLAVERRVPYRCPAPPGLGPP